MVADANFFTSAAKKFSCDMALPAAKFRIG